MEKRDLQLEDYGISKYRYRELLNFCMQYNEKKEALRALTSIKSTRFCKEGGGAGGVNRPTEALALKKIRLEEEVKLIEQTAIEAGEDLYAYILSNVADGVRYEHLEVPCGRRQFYRMRQLFFCILSAKH